MKFSAEFVCFDGCGERYPLHEVVTRCQGCGALLDVEHDMDALATLSGKEWKALFDERWGKASWPYSSGVWSKVEWVYPSIHPESIVSLGEGRTPLLPSSRLAKILGVRTLHIKQCGVSHTGSFKDLGMTVLVSAVQEMLRRGKSIRAIGCASTGDTSAALAAFCAAAGIPAVVFLPRGKISTAQLVQPLANHAKVLSLDTDFDGCMSLVQSLAEEGCLYLANSMNPLRLEGQKTAAIEICQERDWTLPDYLILPGGNLGNVYAFGRGFQMMKELGLTDRVPRLVVAQAREANPLYLSYLSGFESYAPQLAGETEATAIRIGDPVSIHRAIRMLKATDGIVCDASEEELSEAAALSDRYGLYTDPHTGVALAALRKLTKSGEIGPDADVVVVSTAHGLKFTEHKVHYHDGTLPISGGGTHRNRPLELNASLADIRALLEH